MFHVVCYKLRKPIFAVIQFVVFIHPDCLYRLTSSQEMAYTNFKVSVNSVRQRGLFLHLTQIIKEMFDFIAFKTHWPNDSCFKPCPTETVTNNLAEIQYPPLTDKHQFCIVCTFFSFNQICGDSNNSFLYLYQSSDNMVLTCQICKTNYL